MRESCKYVVFYLCTGIRSITAENTKLTLYSIMTDAPTEYTGNINGTDSTYLYHVHSRSRAGVLIIARDIAGTGKFLLTINSICSTEAADREMEAGTKICLSFLLCLSECARLIISANYRCSIKTSIYSTTFAKPFDIHFQ